MTARFKWECIWKFECGFSFREFILCPSSSCHSQEKTQAVLLFGLTKSFLILLLKSKTLKFTIWLKVRSCYIQNYHLVSKTGIGLLLIDCFSYTENHHVFRFVIVYCSATPNMSSCWQNALKWFGVTYSKVVCFAVSLRNLDKINQQWEPKIDSKETC